MIDTVLMGILLYGLISLLTRRFGKDAYARITVFDFIVLVITIKTIHHALLHSALPAPTASVIVVLAITVALSILWLKLRWQPPSADD